MCHTLAFACIKNKMTKIVTWLPYLLPLFLLSTDRLDAFTFSGYRHHILSTRPCSGSLHMTSTSSFGGSNRDVTSNNKSPSWNDLETLIGQTAVGEALNHEVKQRSIGKGSPHVQNALRLFDSPIGSDPKITLYRDHAGWCPYCQKTMLLVEEKRIPIKISLVPMRSYGDKPESFMRKVPSGLLPAIEVDGRVITESQVIMELLDQWHSSADGYRPMMPKVDDQVANDNYIGLAKLERELFSWWCTLVFRPEGPSLGGGNLFSQLRGGGTTMSGAMKGFLDCMKMVDNKLLATKGPWFFDEQDYPTMIDFIYVSHVERILASCAYWKGLNLRDPKWNLKGLNQWLEAFEKRDAYLAFKSDYYTHVMDIPPQYGPGYDGGFNEDRESFARTINGRDGSWHLPLPFDDPLQPLYHGPPLPLTVLEAMDLHADANGSYYSCDTQKMEITCRMMAAWKLAGNGQKVAGFAARGGPRGSTNPRKSFTAPLADPYAMPDEDIREPLDAVLRVVCEALMATDQSLESYQSRLGAIVDETNRQGVISSLKYLRDRVGVPRDLPLASARYLRAYLNWAIDNVTTFL